MGQEFSSPLIRAPAQVALVSRLPGNQLCVKTKASAILLSVLFMFTGARRWVKMPRSCSIGTCTNHSSLYDKTSGKALYAFYRFPCARKYPERRKQWADACCRKDRTTGKPWRPKDEVTGVYVCSAHFRTGRISFCVKDINIWHF